jgi:hypothetical protein
MKPPPENAQSSDDEVLVDNTEPLALKSRKTSRLKRKMERKTRKEAAKPHLLSLSPELLLYILSFLRPSDVFRFQRTCKSGLMFTEHHDGALARAIAAHRYPALVRCFPRPVLLEDVDPVYRAALLDDRRQRQLSLHRRPYAHIPSHDPDLLCSCLTCVLAWNNLCLLVDLAHWTETSIARREPIPMIPRGQNTDWNIALNEQHAAIVRRAVTSPLWHLMILQRHLQTTIFSIRRYAPRDKDASPTFDLTDGDVAAETDAFCARVGPPSYEFPLHRDVYYGLQAYLPNRGWNKSEGRWRYQPEDQHFADLRWVLERAEKEKRENEAAGRA